MRFGYSFLENIHSQASLSNKKKAKKEEIPRFVVLFNHEKTKQKGENPSMPHLIIDTYKIKWEILNLARNFSGDLPVLDAKFFVES